MVFNIYNCYFHIFCQAKNIPIKHYIQYDNTGFGHVERRFGRVERMDEYRMARRMLMAKVSGDGNEGDQG